MTCIIMEKNGLRTTALCKYNAQGLHVELEAFVVGVFLNQPFIAQHKRTKHVLKMYEKQLGL